MNRFRSHFAWIASTILWVGCIVLGFTLLAWEEFTPVAKTASQSQFPGGAGISLSTRTPTLVLFLHPQCPCSRATLHELDEIRAQTQGKLAINIVFTIPKDTPPDWEQGELWSKTHAMAGVRVLRDDGGSVARRFNVIGSGHALLYGPSGQLLFSGGITGSRGEEGGNAGETAVIDLVLKGHSAVAQTPVYGCSLL